MYRGISESLRDLLQKRGCQMFGEEGIQSAFEFFNPGGRQAGRRRFCELPSYNLRILCLPAL